MILLRWCGWCCLLIGFLSSCESAVTSNIPLPTDITDDIKPSTGLWTLQYTGDCSGRESETLDIITLTDEQIIFDEFTLTKNAENVYVGSIQSVAPMPADGRDIIFETAIEVIQVDVVTFSGKETITESGKLSDDCPIKFVYQDD